MSLVNSRFSLYVQIIMRLQILSILFLLFILPLQGLFSIDSIAAIGTIAGLSPGLTPEGQSELYHTGKTSRFYFENENPSLYLPNTSLSDLTAADLMKMDPNIGVETIYLFKAPEISATGKDMLFLYNLLRNLRSLEGIEYYSASRERMRTFFKDFYTIDGPEERNPVPDQFVDKVPREATLYAFQEDLTFGKSVSRLLYRYEKPFISLSITNCTKLRYLLIPLIQEEAMKMHLLIYVMDGYIMFYGNCAVSTLDFPSLLKKKKESFSNRIEAMYTWFHSQYSEHLNQ